MTDQENFGNEFALLVRNKLEVGYSLSQLDLAYIRLIGRTVYGLMDSDKRPEAEKNPADFIVPAVDEIDKQKLFNKKNSPDDLYKIFIDAGLLNKDLTVNL